MPADSLKRGTIVRLRTRHWVVQDVDAMPGGSTVSLACADDDAQGEELEVVWEAELDRKIISDLAATDNAAFLEIVNIAKNALKNKPGAVLAKA